MRATLTVSLTAAVTGQRTVTATGTASGNFVDGTGQLAYSEVVIDFGDGFVSRQRGTCPGRFAAAVTTRTFTVTHSYAVAGPRRITLHVASCSPFVVGDATTPVAV